MATIVRVNADHGRDFLTLADHMTTLRKGDVRKSSAFLFSLQLLFDQILSNLILCPVIFRKKNTYKSCTNELACRSEY